MESGQQFPKLGKYIILKTLGSGAYSKVKLVEDSETGNRYAMKIHSPDSSALTLEIKNTIANEVKAIRSFDHPNIVKIVDFIEAGTIIKPDGRTKDVIYNVVEELCENGELFYFVLNSGYFDEKVSRHYFRQLMEGLRYMH